MRYWIIFLFTITIAISQNEGYIDSTMIRNPKIAWKLGLIPGLGQLYNGKYLKAIGFIAGEYMAVITFNKFNNTKTTISRDITIKGLTKASNLIK